MLHDPGFSARHAALRVCRHDLPHRPVDGIARIEHFIHTGLIEFEDVEDRWRYYVDLFAHFRAVMQKFVDAYGYGMAAKFLDSFPEWARASKEGEVTKRRGVLQADLSFLTQT